jgi:hypothetical protein
MGRVKNICEECLTAETRRRPPPVSQKPRDKVGQPASESLLAATASVGAIMYSA